MKQLLLTIALLSISSLAQAQDATPEDKAYEKIEAIPEVALLIKNDTGKVWQLMMRTTKRPDSTFKYFWIRVGQTNGQSFYPQYNFYVDAKTYDVFMLDTKTDSLFTLEQMRLKESH